MWWLSILDSWWLLMLGTPFKCVYIDSIRFFPPPRRPLSILVAFLRVILERHILYGLAFSCRLSVSSGFKIVGTMSSMTTQAWDIHYPLLDWIRDSDIFDSLFTILVLLTILFPNVPCRSMEKEWERNRMLKVEWKRKKSIHEEDLFDFTLFLFLKWGSQRSAFSYSN